jgi:hypothetical protein
VIIVNSKTASRSQPSPTHVRFLQPPLGSPRRLLSFACFLQSFFLCSVLEVSNQSPKPLNCSIRKIINIINHIAENRKPTYDARPIGPSVSSASPKISEIEKVHVLHQGLNFRQ